MKIEKIGRIQIPTQSRTEKRRQIVQFTLLEDDNISFKEKQAEIDEQFNGSYAIQYSDPTLSPEQVMEAYHGLWKIE